MPVLQAKLEVPAGTTSAWVDTDGTSNIVIGFKGDDQRIEYHLGDATNIYNQRVGQNVDAVVIAKASAVRLKSLGKVSSWLEVFG